jgi:hypothetical protein
VTRAVVTGHDRHRTRLDAADLALSLADDDAGRARSDVAADRDGRRRRYAVSTMRFGTSPPAEHGVAPLFGAEKGEARMVGGAGGG